ncbi:heterokaryon incompatibility protein [Rutstroemia sp. NJR-2017a WRK4]|nr:heterokaryon incompatibility protein [Rutstroemia sp. NJR-2017a WRK4]
MDGTLCDSCLAIPQKLFFDMKGTGIKTLHLHHTSIKNLQNSAKNGCHVCELFSSTISASPFRNEAHRTYFKVDGMRGMYPNPYRNLLSYHVGQDGLSYLFDVETSDDPYCSTLSPKSERVMLVALSWIRECRDTHEHCNMLYDTQFRPRRLIEVGRRGKSPRLIETSFHGRDYSKYLALSHCWGKEMPEIATTKLATLNERKAGIPFRRLPRTFRDALTVTRGLGIQFLWIDSLCIVQDSAEDWQQESAVMGKIYSHAYCTIAAAAAANCDDGLFASHNELPFLPPRQGHPGVLLKPLYTGWDTVFHRSTLNRRSWTLQERELSPRILYFTKHTMLFECREARISDRDYIPGHSKWTLKSSLSRGSPDRTLRCLDKIYNSNIAGANHELAVAKHYELWRNMVQDYAKRELTHRTDKFPALSGLATEFAYLLDDEYVAGLWRKDLLKGLCWKWFSNNARRQSTVNYGPSWSWAKMDIPITYELLREDRIFRRRTNEKEFIHVPLDVRFTDPAFLHVSIIPEGKDPNGTLTMGRIFLSGQVIQPKRSKNGDFMVNAEILKVNFDHLPQPPVDVFLLSLGSTSVGLVLVPLEEGGKEYQRIGLVAPTEWEWFENAKFEEITLV